MEDELNKRFALLEQSLEGLKYDVDKTIRYAAKTCAERKDCSRVMEYVKDIETARRKAVFELENIRKKYHE